MAKRSGRPSSAQTPAPKSDKIVGSNTNKKGSATSKGASSISLSDKTISALKTKLEEFKKKYPKKDNVSLSDLKAVYRRGSGAFSGSHRPNISRAGWSYARTNKFLEKAAGKKVKSAYVQDDDLLKYEDGGKILEKIIPIFKWKRMGIRQEDDSIKWVNSNEFFLWIYDDIEAEKKLNDGIYEYPYPTIYFNDDLEAIWSNNKFKQYNGNKHIISFIEGRCSKNFDKDGYRDMEIYVMTTRPNFRRKGVNEFAIKYLRDKFKLKKEQVSFYMPSEQGNKFILSDKYHLGGEMTMHLAPNGKPSNLTHEQWHLVRTPEFKAWFGDWENDPINASQVVDDNGEPLVVYRGMPKKRRVGNVFKYNVNLFGTKGVGGRQTNKFAFYFTDIKEVAEDYVNDITEDEGGYIVKSYFLNVRKLFKAFSKKNQYETTFKELYDLANTSGNPVYFRNYRGEIETDYKGNKIEVWNHEYEWERKYNSKLPNKNEPFVFFVDWDKTQGNQYFWRLYLEDYLKYNGLVFYETTNNAFRLKINDDLNPKYGDEFSKTYGVFEPNQIKLADGSNTTFDSANPDIRYEEGGKVGEEIICSNCGWEWNTADSEGKDKYICHKCGYTNNKYYQYESKGILIGDLDSLTNKLLAQKIKTFIDNVKPIFYYYINEDSNNLIIGLDENYIEGAEDRLKKAAKSDMEFFDVDSLKINYNSNDKQIEYSIKLNKEAKFGNNEIQNNNYMKNGGELNPDNKETKEYYSHKSGNVGGMLVGNRHSEGGIKATNKSNGQPIEMEGGEVVITRNAVSDNTKREFNGQMLTNKQILSKINQSGGGVSFEDGGELPENIMVSGKEYSYGGKVMKDHEIVSSCGCKHSMAEGGKVKGKLSAKLIHLENVTEYYKNDSLIKPTSEQKISWSIYGLPNDIEKNEEKFETTIYEFYGNTKKDIENQYNEKLSNGDFDYLGYNPNTILQYNNSMAEGGEVNHRQAYYATLSNKSYEHGGELDTDDFNDTEKNVLNHLKRSIHGLIKIDREHCNELEHIQKKGIVYITQSDSHGCKDVKLTDYGIEVVRQMGDIQFKKGGEVGCMECGCKEYKKGGATDENTKYYKGTKHEYNNQFEINKAIEELITDIEAKDLTPEEKQFVSYYAGYGGLEKFGAKGKGLLYEYFTPSEIAKKMWGLAYKHGFKGGLILEPSCGIGEFIKYAPEQNLVTGYEINEFSAKICKILYPMATIQSKYFETLFIKNNSSIRDKTEGMGKYSLVIGNPPYGSMGGIYAGLGEKSYTKANNYIDYFIFRGLDLLQSDGLLIYIIGTEVAAGGVPFLQQGMNAFKENITKKADIVDAYRLPNGLFETTDVLTDIIVFKKR
jgi:hypothetical protein